MNRRPLIAILAGGLIACGGGAADGKKVESQLAAIPAAIAFNYFMHQMRILSRSMDMFSAEFLNIARRQFFK